MTPTDRGSTPPAEAETAELAVVSSPPLTVWLGSAMYTFPAGRDVTVGRNRYGCAAGDRAADPPAQFDHGDYTNLRRSDRGGEA
ncbi:MAG: hypothetical protein ACLP3C_02750 [Mycobacterium sp.]|uniref:hypothetical protein n=1 Tax=Mycobacterium sp. TaxID=1785 RepID=UPI003F97893A